MDYRKSAAPVTTVTRNLDLLTQGTGNIYETVIVVSRRANQISVEMKQELNKKLEELETIKKIKIQRRDEILSQYGCTSVLEFSQMFENAKVEYEQKKLEIQNYVTDRAAKVASLEKFLVS